MAEVEKIVIFTKLYTVLIVISILHAVLCERNSNDDKSGQNAIELDFAPTALNMIKETPTSQEIYIRSLKNNEKVQGISAEEKITKRKRRFREKKRRFRGGRRNKISGLNQMKEGLMNVLGPDNSEDQRPVKRYHFEDGFEFNEHHHLDERPILGRCDINEQCKAEQYCEGVFCYKCRKEEEHCYANGQCCKGMECQYGYCAKGISAGMPGTYCDKAKDCKGSDKCCILEMSVDHHNPICKPMLEEHETCGPINLFHQITMYRAHNEPICGPCKQGLACKSIGINGHHSVCLPEGAD